MPLRLIVSIDPLDAWLRGSCHLHCTGLSYQKWEMEIPQNWEI